MLVLDSLTGEQRVHTVLQRRAHPRQLDSVAKQVAQITQLAWSYVRLRQQIGTRQQSLRASTASVFTRAAAIAFVRNGCERCNSCPAYRRHRAHDSRNRQRTDRHIRRRSDAVLASFANPE